MKSTRLIAAFAALVAVSAAHAQIRITEFAHNMATSLEYVEFTNVGNSAIDMTGWSFDDSNPVPGTVNLSDFGIVAAGESVLLIELTDAAAFRTAWGLGSNVKVIAGNTNNLGGSDEINLFDASNALVDKLTYTGSVSNVSRNAPLVQLGANNNPAWEQSVIGDSYGSYADTFQNVGNPGQYLPVPEPATLTALAVIGLAAARRRRA